jgi:flagellar assembly protein FliH
MEVVEPAPWAATGAANGVPAGTPVSSGFTSNTAEAAQLRQQLAESERRRQNEVSRARQEGFAQGAQQAREEAAAEIRAVVERVAATVADLATTKRRVRAEAESELLKLSIAIARRIMHRELALDPEALWGIIHGALQKLHNRDVARVRVTPAAAQSVRAALDRAGAPPGIEVLPDPSLRAGDLIFETSMGQLDASVETQLIEIERGLTDRLALAQRHA